MRYLIFDIETVPLPQLDDALNAEVEKRTQREIDRGLREHDEAESLVRSISPFFGRLLAVGMRLYNDETNECKDKVICHQTEEDTLTEFLETVNHPASRDLRFVHYNGLGFDVPFIIIRAAHFGMAIENRRFLNQKRFYFDIHIDIMQFLSRWGREPVSLDMACHSFGIPSPKEGEVQGNSVAAAFEAGDLEGVEKYVLRDVEATYELFLKIRQYL